MEIDIQHANIAFMLTELAKEGSEKEVSERKFEIIRNALAHHFDFEEKWGQANNRNFDSDHRDSHKELLEKLNELYNQYTNNKLNMCEISLTTKMELLKHVQNHDMRLNA
ncbi:MAG: hypothetical protein HON76_18525 [Candidatus Scalindua sp.]|nr:hypothetical protein [Candidatus Scalindua sp.]MBT6230282.1 hypothetical protein [Candidatus Scalindua sp.]MBT6564517.1 hypothetical protein [Candidatus Scalindua sp.]MBT7213016.1 hypothetical protein [Candidatus Scalindua sp.]MBT7590219.1 hypothetical protein [Candidatus Scalindua sp.]